jgi:hypothetical protein
MKQSSKAIEFRVAVLLLIFLMGTASPAVGAITATSDVFVGGAEGPQGTSNYRIPGMVVAHDGSILAFAEGRRSGTDPGQAGFPIDLVMKRSTNGGQTWNPLVVLEADAAFDYDDPTPVVDETTGDVHLIYGRVPDDCGLFCVPAGTGSDSMNVWQMTSSDNGQNWSAPVNLTSQVKDPSWKGIVPGPGSGIQLRWQDSALSRNGRLVVPGSINANRNLIFYSDDNGANWQHGNLAQDDLGLGGSFNGNENEVVELTDGDLLMNSRPSGGNSRRMFRSSDGGATWIESYNGPSPITTVDASMIRYSAVRDGDQRDRILFSGPLGDPVGSGSGRRNIGVWTSYDEGRTFINPVQLGSGHAAYSVLQKLNDDSIGLVYEATGSTLIRYLGFDIEELERAAHPTTMSHYDGFGNEVDAFRGGVGWSGAWNNSGVTANSGALEFAGFFSEGDDQHARLRDADMTRDLGSGALDLNDNQDYYFSLFVNHDSADGNDASSNEWLDVRLLDGGSQQFAFGVISSEAFFVRNENTGSNVLSPADTLQTDTTYLLLAKLAAQDDSNGDNSDQLFLAWYDDPAQVPADQAQINWQLAGQTSNNFAGAIDEIFIGGAANADWLVDGLRIGTTFDAVIVDTGVGQPPVLGDLNDDFLISVADWLVFRGNFTMDTSALPAEDQLGAGDFDQSGLIDPADYITFVDLYDAANGAGAFAGLAIVPEPGSLVLLAMGIILTCTRNNGSSTSIATR